jgi:hypothetical protein
MRSKIPRGVVYFVVGVFLALTGAAAYMGLIIGAIVTKAYPLAALLTYIPVGLWFGVELAHDYEREWRNRKGGPAPTGNRWRPPVRSAFAELEDLIDAQTQSGVEYP